MQPQLAARLDSSLKSADSLPASFGAKTAIYSSELPHCYQQLYLHFAWIANSHQYLNSLRSTCQEINRLHASWECLFRGILTLTGDDMFRWVCLKVLPLSGNQKQGSEVRQHLLSHSQVCQSQKRAKCCLEEASACLPLPSSTGLTVHCTGIICLQHSNDLQVLWIPESFPVSVGVNYKASYHHMKALCPCRAMLIYDS